MTVKWFDEHNEKDSSLVSIEKERRALSAAFTHYESFGFEGLALRVDGQIIAWLIMRQFPIGQLWIR